MSKTRKTVIILALAVTLLLTGCGVFYYSLKSAVECTVPALSNSVLILSQRLRQERAVAELVEESCGYFETCTLDALRVALDRGATSVKRSTDSRRGWRIMPCTISTATGRSSKANERTPCPCRRSSSAR